MKPSMQSHLFRLVSMAMSTYMASKGGVDEWRKLSVSLLERPRVPHGVELQQIKIGDIPAEWLIPTRADNTGKAILYFHGGAWIFGWYAPHRMLVGHLAREANTRALAVDYRLAPEYSFPAALDDCVAAYDYLLESGIRPDQVIMAGDSAGGNLVITAMLALRAANKPLPAAGVCISPVTDMMDEGESNVTNAKRDAMLSAGFAARLGSIMRGAYGGRHDLHDPLISPIYANLQGLPPLLVQAGEDEVLLSSITAFVNKARQEGVQVTYEVWPAMWHVWHIFTPYMPEARYAVSSISRFIEDVSS